MKRAGVVITILVAVLALGCGFVAATAAVDVTQPSVQGSTASINFEVQKGDSTAEVATKLEQAGLIRNAQLFRLWARYRHLDKGIQYGIYKLSPSMTMDAIIAKLQKSIPDQISVTVLPGSRVTQYPDDMSDLPNFNADKFLAIATTGKWNDGTLVSKDYWYVSPLQPHAVYALEGYLYPDTYFFDRSATEEDVIRRMLDTLGEKLCPASDGQPADQYIRDAAQCKAHAITVGKSNTNIFKAMEQKYSTSNDVDALYHALTLGSIVMREIPKLSDAQGVANVYYNRYLVSAGKLAADVGTLLQADPTTQYARDTDNPPKDGGWWKVLQGDVPANIAPKNPYNTYVAPGLPPGPISAAAWDVIVAAANPNPDGPTPYFYFLNDTCQGHATHYAANNNDFEALKQKYLVQKQC